MDYDVEIVTPSPEKKPPVIIIKRGKPQAHGAHGGAWKVAYADFVTAMMALFIVLWLMGADDDVKKAVSAFFTNPSGPGKLTGTASAGSGHSIEIPKTDMKKLREKLQQAMLKVPNFNDLKNHVEITVTSDGLRIELTESEAGVFFEQGKPLPSNGGEELLKSLAAELGALPNPVFIEGHTDSKPFGGDGAYGNWELSTDRANSARRVMEANGLRASQVTQVRGYADRQLRHPEDPTNASNRRISVIVQYTSDADKPAPDPAPAPAAPAAPAPPAPTK